MEIRALYPNFSSKSFQPAVVVINNGKIAAVNFIQDKGIEEKGLPIILPGMVDSHIHIESSMLTPGRFAEIAVQHGTVATVSDPHEIANVLGSSGVDFMIRDAENIPLKIFYTAPSCVPATSFEKAGAVIDSSEVAGLLARKEIVALGEMMNFPGVIFDDQEVHAKLAAARMAKKPVDGHAPGLSGSDLKKYVGAGISTDHEAVTLDEAREKLSLGMKILIREGSAAKNFSALNPLISEAPDRIMLCSDDLHPDDLLSGHLNLLVKRALALGYDIFDLLRITSLNAIEHYGLNVGQLKVGDPADFILVDSLQSFKILSTWIDGEEVYNGQQISFNGKTLEKPNQFISRDFKASDFELWGESGMYRVIEAVDGSLLTNSLSIRRQARDGKIHADTENDILKMAVVNRYEEAQPAIGLIKNIGIKSGAFASSVAHDSHNIVVVGCSDEDIAGAVNCLIRNKGGICVVNEKNEYVLPLPVAGIISDESCEEVAGRYSELSSRVKDMGSRLTAPFMTLSFMALLVIPTLKLGDRGLFDVTSFNFVSINDDKQ